MSNHLIVPKPSRSSALIWEPVLVFKTTIPHNQQKNKEKPQYLLSLTYLIHQFSVQMILVYFTQAKKQKNQHKLASQHKNIFSSN